MHRMPARKLLAHEDASWWSQISSTRDSLSRSLLLAVPYTEPSLTVGTSAPEPETLEVTSRCDFGVGVAPAALAQGADGADAEPVAGAADQAADCRA
jgi:hypothetical protein